MRLRFASHTQRVHTNTSTLAHTVAHAHLYIYILPTNFCVTTFTLVKVIPRIQMPHCYGTLRNICFLWRKGRGMGDRYLFGIPRIRRTYHTQKPLCALQLFSRLLFYQHFFLSIRLLPYVHFMLPDTLSDSHNNFIRAICARYGVCTR